MPELISISDLVIDHQLQSRAEMNIEAIRDYTLAMIDGDEFPPIDVYRLDGQLTLVAGFHRVEAAKAAGKRKILANIYDGSRKDAVRASAKSNLGQQAIRYTNADKRRTVTMILTDPEWLKESQHKIANEFGVRQSFVSKVYRELLDAGELEPKEKIIVDRPDGSTYEMDVKNIGGKGGTPQKEKSLSTISKAKPKDSITSPPEEIIKEVEPIELEVPEIEDEEIDEQSNYDDLKVGDIYHLGEHTLIINPINKMKKPTNDFDHCFWFSDIKSFLKVQKWLDPICPSITVSVLRGSDYPSLLDIDWDISYASLAAIDGHPLLLAHYGEIKPPSDLTVGHWGSLPAELTQYVSEPDSDVLIVSPLGLCIDRIHARQRHATVITDNLDYARAELLQWSTLHPDQIPEKA